MSVEMEVLAGNWPQSITPIEMMVPNIMKHILRGHPLWGVKLLLT